MPGVVDQLVWVSDVAFDGFAYVVDFLFRSCWSMVYIARPVSVEMTPCFVRVGFLFTGMEFSPFFVDS